MKHGAGGAPSPSPLPEPAPGAWRGALLLLAFFSALAGPLAGAPAEPLNPPVPLTPKHATLSAGSTVATVSAAQRAQELGLPTVAIGLYQELMTAPGTDKAALTLPLVTALLDAGRASEAEQLLNSYTGNRGHDWKLRMGLAAAQLRRFDLAREMMESTDVDSLTSPDRTWFWFLQGVLNDTATPRDVSRANERYQLAEKEAPSDFARASYFAAEKRVRINLVTYSREDVESVRRAYESEQQKGRAAYQTAEDYAMRLAATGQKAEAVRFLSDVLLRIPRAERQWTDRFRLLLGVIGDRMRGGAGRNALNLLLAQGSTPDLQRQGLQLLAQDSQREPERGLFRAELDRLIAGNPKAPISDGVLLMRTHLALAEKDYATAERRANELKESFPGSDLRSHAFVALASSAWEQRRYRVAAENARLAREVLAASPGATARFESTVVAAAIADLRVFEAEARFRAQDYRLAADAYEAALSHPPAGIKAGDLMFQQALAAIRADQDDPKKDLARIVDELAADPRFDSTNRWEAEWSLARGLKVQGRGEVALARVTNLLDSADASAVSAELRARMRWLQVRLSVDANNPKLTLQLAPKLKTVTDGLPADLRAEIASTSALLMAQAHFKLGDEAAARETLEALRREFPVADATKYSYIVEAGYYAEPGRDKIQDAQTTLRRLIDDPKYQQSPYVPYALFNQALLSERLGQEKDLREANQRIEELVSPERNAPPELVFAARLKQGDLLRTLNDFARAQVAYEDLVNNPKYAQRPDVVVAQLRLAECHNAQSSTDPTGSHADIAQSMFEELLYRVSVPTGSAAGGNAGKMPADVRVEAGYNLGKMLERRGQYEKARSVWFADVITPFLLESKAGESMRATVPYWLARTLLDLGELLEQRENMDEARRTYVLLRDSKLGYGEGIAVERLQRLGIPATAAAPVQPTGTAEKS